MSVADFVDVPIEVMAGLVTQISAADLPHGASPSCQDVQFSEGNVQTRPGLLSQYQLAGNPTINYLKSFLSPQPEPTVISPRLLSLDSLGNLRTDPSPGGNPLQLISSQIVPGSFGKSVTAFNREYIAFSDGEQGIDIPRQWDGANFDRVSQVGPAAAPQAADENFQFSIVASPSGLNPLPTNVIAVNGATQTGTLVTITMTSGMPVGLLPGQQCLVAGVGVAGYNGTQTLTAVNYSALQIQYLLDTEGLAPSGGGTVDSGIVQVTVTTPVPTLMVGQSMTIAGASNASYDGTFPITFLPGGDNFVVPIGQFGLAASGGGTATTAGNITAGKHQLSVIFLTRNGYYTKPAPPNFWTAAGGKRVQVVNIPTGPPSVKARVICFTGAGGASFYHLTPPGLTVFSSNMVIPDNTTTSATFDFTDATLQLGTLDDPLFNLIELPECAGVVEYSDRLAWWGARNYLTAGLLNLPMDGGLSTAASSPAFPNYPLGWTPDATNGAGGTSANTLNAVPGSAPVPFFGDAYVIKGDGATAIRGKIFQTAYQDYLGNSILAVNTGYTVRVRIAAQGATQGTIHVNLQSTIGGFTTVGVSQAFNTLNGNYQVFEGDLTAGLATIPTDLQLQVYVDGTANNGAVFAIKILGIYPTKFPIRTSDFIVSGNVDTNAVNTTAESYDSETGVITPSENNGQQNRTAFKIRERLYLNKDNSLFATQDDGINEPADWTITPISDRVGTPSINGVGGAYNQTGGEDWAVIAHRTGLYIYFGGGVAKICPEIQPTWDTINWQVGSTVSVAIDTQKRRIYVCAPFANSASPNETLVLDYHDVGGPDMIASMEPVKTSYMGKRIVVDKARKWCPWTIAANCVAPIDQGNGTSIMYFGSNDGTGNINALLDSQLTDNGNAIPSFYVTSFFPELAAEQALQLRSHRKLFGYLTVYAQGLGQLGVTVFPDSLSNAIALNPFTLANPAFKDLEMMTNILAERVAYKFSSSGAGQWFSLQRSCVSAKVDPWSPVRGGN